MRLLLIFFSFATNLLSSQNDTIQKNNKNYIDINVIKEKDSIEDVVKEAKLRSNTQGLIESYLALSKYGELNQKLKYIDSVISLTKDSSYSDFPAKAYIRRAQVLGFHSKFIKAIDALVLAEKYAEINQNLIQEHQIQYMIGLLKIQLGEYKEGIDIFRKIDLFYESISQQDTYSSFDHINTIFGLAYGYSLLKEYDSSHESNKKAIGLIKNYNDYYFYPDLLISSAITHYYRKEYRSSLDSISKYKEITQGKKKKAPVEIMSKIFLGHILKDKYRTNEALVQYKEADSLIFSFQYFNPDIRPMYENLLKILKEEDDLKSQLHYMNRLIKVDSTLRKTYQNTSYSLNTKYSTPILLNEKQKIIKLIENKYQRTTYVVIIVISLLLILTILWYRSFQKNRFYQRRFEELVQKDLKIEKKLSNDQNTKISSSHELSSYVETDILMKLNEFEHEKEFLNSDLSINILSKRFETNTKYLSIVINNIKNKTFQNYINDLRIDYIIDRLKNDEKLRQYKIAYLAKECGFNTPQAFSISFKKRTKLNPSYFIKSLNKQGDKDFNNK